MIKHRSLLLLVLSLLFREVCPKFIAWGIRASRKIVHSRRNMGNIADSAEVGRIPRAGEGLGGAVSFLII